MEIEGFDFPEELYYSEDGRYWIKMEGENVKIGLTGFGAQEYGIYAIWVKSRGTYIARGENFAGFVGRSAGGLAIPVSGTIVDANDRLKSSPELIERDSYNDGWIVVIKPSKLEEELKLLKKVTSEDFKKLLEEKLKKVGSKKPPKEHIIPRPLNPFGPDNQPPAIT